MNRRIFVSTLAVSVLCGCSAVFFNPATSQQTLLHESGWFSVALGTSNQPSARQTHTMVWTGSRVFIWGGTSNMVAYPRCVGLSDGGLYNPTTETWSTVQTTNAPTARCEHAWAYDSANQRIFIWGGKDNFTMRSDGAIYDIASNTWTTMGVAGSPPAARAWSNGDNPGGAWDPSSGRFIVWGGHTDAAGATRVNTGAMYDPVAGSWTTMSVAAAPAGRDDFTHAWDPVDRLYLVWGGLNVGGASVATGARFDPVAGANGTWTAMAAAGLTARYAPAGVWTGSSFMVWGGNDGAAAGDGALYNPGLNTWTPIAAGSPGEPLGRSDPAAVVTSNSVILWGGAGTGAECASPYTTCHDGGIFNLTSQTWTALPSTLSNNPIARNAMGYVWMSGFGGQGAMMIWGGNDGGAGATAAYRCLPATDYCSEGGLYFP